MKGSKTKINNINNNSKQYENKISNKTPKV